MDVIKRIEELRQERKWSKYELAEESMLTYSTLASMYARQTPPKLDVLEMICKAFGISLSEFFIENDRDNIITENEKELIRIYRNLTEEKRKALFTLIDENR